MPLDGIQACAYLIGPQRVNCTVTDEQGVYKINDLVTEDYRVLIQRLPHGIYLPETTDVIRVTEGQVTTAVDVALIVGGRITGRIVWDYNGQPIYRLDQIIFQKSSLLV